MKEATGELNMTIVTLVAITAVGALLYFVVWPMIQRMIVENTCQTYGSAWHAEVGTECPAGTEGRTCFQASEDPTDNSDAEVKGWLCKKTETAPAAPAPAA